MAFLYGCQVLTLFLRKSTLISFEEEKSKFELYVSEKNQSHSLCDERTFTDIQHTFSISFASVQLSRDVDVYFYTGLQNTTIFNRCLFDHSVYQA